MSEENKTESSMTTEEAIQLALKDGQDQFNATMRQILSMGTPAAINYEIAALEEFAITCLAHHVFNHGIGAHFSTVTPFGTWNPSQAYTKEQEIAERILEASKRVKQQYLEKKGTVSAINPDFKNVADKFKESQNENSNQQQ